MEIIDVCDNYAGKGCFTHYYQKNKIKNYKVICTGLNLSIGDIKKDRLSF